MVKTAKLFSPKREIQPKKLENRGSRHDRGYDYEWSKAAAHHLKLFPLCVECDRNDRVELATVVDHKIPIRCRADLRMKRENWWGLCHQCHNGIKRRMEAYAEKADMVDQLILWCDDPTARPAALQRPRRFSKETMIV